jgi:hypothetical protein
MATSKGKLESLMKQVTENKKIHFDELDHLVENCRWLTTLVLAEIAGLAAYRELLKEENLSISFAIIVMILAVSIFSFMISVIFSRQIKKNLSIFVINSLNESEKIEMDGEIPPNEGDRKVDGIAIIINKEISSKPRYPRSFELAGIISFLVGSILTAIVLFITEIGKIFGC